ncbi:MAG: DUF445 family protein [Desulfobulbaceae bacterium]|jgi:uncharacterized membrane protein YheB (UPF0754 family)|nr:DUF445 family protein [Desulfobulbaceae bacterium]
MNSVFLAYAGPPIIGAFIGYLTNKIAIRMLFRPLKQWRILGMPVPMTPGVIPSKRHRLADNIGTMVGAHLLTSRDIGAALSEERFQDRLGTLVDDWVNDLLNRDLGSVRTIVPPRFQAYLEVAVRTAKYRIRTGLQQFIQSDEFAGRVSRAVAEQLDVMGARPLESMVSRKERQALYGFLGTLVKDLLAGRRAEDWLAARLQRNFRQAAEEGKTIADYLPDTLRELIVATVLRRSPDMLRQLSKVLTEPLVRERIIEAVRAGIRNFMDSLGPLGAMAGGFLNLKVFEGVVREYLSGQEDNIRSWLENPEVQERFAAMLAGQVEKYLETPLSRILEGMEEEQLESICRELAIQVMAIVRCEGVAGALSSMLRDSFEEMLDGGRSSAAEISGRLMRRETVQAFRQSVGGETVSLLRSQRVARLIDTMMDSLLDDFLDRPVGVLHTILPPGVRAGITDYAVLTINRILLREVPNLVELLNIRQMVAGRVNSLDLLKLEQLLLSIMEEQFKYINLFGALLGFLIGLINVAVIHLL